MVEGTDTFIRVSFVDATGGKHNELLNLSSIERFVEMDEKIDIDEWKRGVRSCAYLKFKTLSSKGEYSDVTLDLATPLDKIFERLVEAKKLAPLSA